MAEDTKYNQDESKFKPEFLIIPMVVWQDKSLPAMAEKVYTVIYWYSRMKDGYCHASNKTIADMIGKTNAKSVSNQVALLKECGYIDVVYGKNLQREAIIPLHHFMDPLHETVDTPPRNRGLNKNIELEKEKKPTKKVDFSAELVDDVHRLYKGWLIEMVIGSRKWLATPEDSRVKTLESAAQKTRLTEKRVSKIQARLALADFTTCAKAIRNCGASDWHRGKNDRGWVATLEWLFHSDERIEEFANRKKVL